MALNLLQRMTGGPSVQTSFEILIQLYLLDTFHLDFSPPGPKNAQQSQRINIEKSRLL
jgi:hypothetical protein